MKICVPTQGSNGLQEAVYGHFGSAPCFTIVDTADGSVHTVNNANLVHEHGRCNPVAALGGHQVDVLVVQGIGGGAAARLAQMGIRILQGAVATVQDAVTAAQSGTLADVGAAGTCGGHHHGGGCGH